jgi:hypothetical protein
MGTYYRLKNYSDPVGGKIDVHQADVFSFKLGWKRHNGFMYGAYWNFKNIGSEDIGLFKTKSIWGVSIGLTKQIKKATWVTTIGIGRDWVVYRDNGNIPRGLLVDGEEFLITRNYLINSTIYLGGGKGGYFGVMYDYIGGTTNLDQSRTFKLTNLEFKLGFYIERK